VIVRQITSDFFEGVLQLLFPPHCLLCGVLGSASICETCLNSLIVPVPMPYCIRCGQVQLGSECSKCPDYPERLVRCRSVGVHQGQLAEVIYQLKYRDKPMLAEPLGKRMADFLVVRSEVFYDLKFNAIIPVPLHKHRERQRGYNQSNRLAIAVGKILDIPVDILALRRIRKTRQQVGMARSGRTQNLRGAFQASPTRCSNRTFLLLDDVSTTGSTITECAQELLRAGASKVYAVSLAAG
jgi:competence protein ComFC